LDTGTLFNFIHFESSFEALCQVDPLSGFEAYVHAPEDAPSKLDWYRRGGEVSENQWCDVLGMLKTTGGTTGYRLS
jgi:hypothetical protein